MISGSSSDFDRQIRHLLESFQQGDDPRAVENFKEKIDELSQTNPNENVLIHLLQRSLEALNNSNPIEGLWSRARLQGSFDQALLKLVSRIRNQNTVKTILASKIEALRSGQAQNTPIFEENLPQKVEDAITRLSETVETSLQNRLFKMIAEMPPEHITPILIRSMTTFLEKMPYAGQKDFLQKIGEISENERADVIRNAELLAQNIKDVRDRIPILKELSRIPADQREGVIRKALPLLQNTKDVHSTIDVLKELSRIPVDQQEDVIQKAGPLLQNRGYGIAQILKELVQIPAAEREEVVQRTMDIRKDDITGQDIRIIIRVLGTIPGQLQSDFIRKAMPILQNIKEYRGRILEALNEIPDAQREDVIRKTEPLFQNINDLDKPVILKEVSRIPADQREDVVRKATILCKRVQSGLDRVYIIRILEAISADLRSDFIQTTMPIFEKFESDHFRGRAFSFVSEIPSKFQSKIVEKTLPMLENANDFEKELILTSILKIPSEQRIDCLEKATPIFQNIKNGYKKAMILHEIAVIPEELIEKAVHFAGGCKSLEKQDALKAYASFPSTNRTEIWTGFLLQLDKIHDPSLQEKLLSFLKKTAKDSTTAHLFESSEFDKLFSNEHSPIFRLFIAYFWAGQNIDESTQAIAVILNSKQSKDFDRKKIILNAFNEFSLARNLSPTEKMDILKIIFSKNEIQSVPALRKRLQSIQNQQEEPSKTKSIEKSVDLIDKINKSLLLLEAICNFDRSAELKEIKKPEDLESLLENILKEILEMNKIPGFFDRYLKTFGAFRDPLGLSVYASKMNSLPSTGKNEALKALKLYVEEVLTGNFPALRYDEPSSKHLSKVFENREALKLRWREGKTLSFEEILPLSDPVASRDFDPKKYLMQRIIEDVHISRDKLHYVASYLKGESPDRKELDEKIEKPEEETNLNLLKLQKGLLSLLQNTRGNLHETFLSEVEPFIERALQQETQFKSDLIGLGKMLAPRMKENSFAGWTVVDTDDPQDLLLCGTEVVGSCQNIRGTPQYNKCLLAYLLDGKNRLIAVKDHKGRIVTRSILRLLWDEKKQAPVLFKETVYSAPHVDAKALEALDRMCLLRAQELQLPLMVQAPSSAPDLDILYSLGSRAPFEYTDAGGGVTNGTFSVTGVSAESS